MLLLLQCATPSTLVAQGDRGDSSAERRNMIIPADGTEVGCCALPFFNATC